MMATFSKWGRRLFLANQAIPQQLFQQVFQQFTNTIAELSLTVKEDAIILSLNSSQDFPVNSCYNAINDRGLRFPYQNNIWHSTVSLKVKVFS